MSILIGAIIGFLLGLVCWTCGFILGYKTGQRGSIPASSPLGKVAGIAHRVHMKATKGKVEFLPAMTPEERKDVDDPVQQKVADINN